MSGKVPGTIYCLAEAWSVSREDSRSCPPSQDPSASPWSVGAQPILAESHRWVGFFKEKRKLRAQSSCSAHWDIKIFKDSTLACGISHFSRVRLLAIIRTGAGQAPLSMGFSRENTISRLCVAPRLTTFHKDKLGQIKA